MSAYYVTDVKKKNGFEQSFCKSCILSSQKTFHFCDITYDVDSLLFLYVLHENTLKVDKTVAYGMSKVRDHSLRVIGSRLVILVNNSNPCVSTLLLDKGSERVCIRISVLQVRKASLFLKVDDNSKQTL